MSRITRHEARPLLTTVLKDIQAGTRGNRNYTPGQWEALENHLHCIGLALTSGVTLTEAQAFRVVEAVEAICLANPVSQNRSSFRGLELLQIVDFVHGCHIAEAMTD